MVKALLTLILLFNAHSALAFQDTLESDRKDIGRYLNGFLEHSKSAAAANAVKEADKHRRAAAEAF
ncbi:MAG: hypothetical protein AB1489_24245 [Acidobacteriota bacterium]